ncbi:MAG: zinc ribbon domain-containing protein [Thermoplasmata archaeon]
MNIAPVVCAAVTLGRRARRDAPRLIRVPKGQKRRAASRKMKVHTRPQVKAVRVKGQTKCDVCLGVIKEDLPSVLCGCGKQYHNSCAVRVVNCPVCGRELGFSRQKPHVVDSDMPVVVPVPLSKDDKLLLLEERFLLGEITERTYLSLKEQVSAAPDEARFCSVCGRRLIDGEKCDCNMYDRKFQCPECGNTLVEDDQFCNRCGVVFSTDFRLDLYQCPECGRVVSEGQTSCDCGVLLVGEGNMICPGCGAEIQESSRVCGVCGKSLVEDITECPACGRRVDKDAFACLCGVVFSDRVSGAECSLCGAGVDLQDKYCPKCGARFADEPRLEGKLERKIRV